MKYVIMTAIVAVLAGCATAATTNGKERVYYDRKYNTNYQLRSDGSERQTPRTAPVYDRKYGYYLPMRDAARQ